MKSLSQFIIPSKEETIKQIKKEVGDKKPTLNIQNGKHNEFQKKFDLL